MNWQITEGRAGDHTALTSSELVGLSIALAACCGECGEPHDELNVYWRAWQKIQPAVKIAMNDND